MTTLLPWLTLFSHFDKPIILLLWFFLSLIIGSFLGMLIYRLPRMLLDDENEATTLSLWRPASHCPQCHHPVRWRHNIPLLGYLMLKGRCFDCNTAISRRYFWVELLTLFGTLLCGFWFDGMAFWAILLAFYLSLPLMFIDAQYKILPDSLVFLLLWGALGLQALGIFPHSISLVYSILSIIGGYLFLWFIRTLGNIIHQQESMGLGDIKLFSAICAWIGLNQALYILVLGASLGIIFWFVLRIRAHRLALPAPQNIAFGVPLLLVFLIGLVYIMNQSVATTLTLSNFLKP